MRTSVCMMALTAMAISGFSAERRLTLADFRDRMKAAWIGQMVGVSVGTPTEFKWKDAIIPEDKAPKVNSNSVNTCTFGNDDLYVEMTFLRTLEKYGLDVSIRQAGLDFANSEYGLWCANLAGRTNLRKGIAPPDSSHPKFNACGNDIDYQIEADYSGIVSPGCPQEAIRLGNLFGRLMNYGDGVWAGQFVGALYAEAYFTSDVDALLDAGLRAIPPESDYAGMVRNVRQWRREFPDDWTKAWEKVRQAYSKTYNRQLKDSNGGIDVRLNGACIILGLVYGGGDIDRSIDISMRCGWDSDCNPSNVGGVLMCARGLSKLDPKYHARADQKQKFSYGDYDLPKLYAVCEALARQVVVRHGGRIEKTAEGEVFVIPEQTPVPDKWVPTWKATPPENVRFTEAEMSRQRHALKLPTMDEVADADPTRCVQKTLDALFPGWKTSVNAPDMKPGYVEMVQLVQGPSFGWLRTHPPKRGEAVVLSRQFKVPTGNPVLHFTVAASKGGDFRLRVRIDGDDLMVTDIVEPAPKDWRFRAQTFAFSLQAWAGRDVTLELVNEATGWMCEAALWHGLSITSNN